VTSWSESNKISLKEKLLGLDSPASTAKINLYGDIQSETAKSLPACKVVPYTFVYMENRMRYPVMGILGI
jgi:hypothetical protein